MPDTQRPVVLQGWGALGAHKIGLFPGTIW